METEPDDQGHIRVAALQLGSAQRARILAVLLHVDVGITGWYLGIPDPLTNLVERLSDPEGPIGERPGDIALEWLPRLHFGRWRDPTWGPWLKALWAIVGVVPAIMFVTGLLMWWNRVVRKRRDVSEAVVELA